MGNFMESTTKNNYLISVTGIQEIDGERDKIEMQTVGSYKIGNSGKTYIGYKEYDERNVCSNNLVKIEGDNLVTIIRDGGKQMRLILEKGRRHQCHYNTIAGDLIIGVYTSIINNELTDEGGKIFVSYELDFNGEFVSKNEFCIDVKEN